MKRLPDRRVSASLRLDGFSPQRADYRATLENLDLIEILKEPEFQELAELASQICATPVSLITLLDAEKQWITSSVGTDLTETSRKVAFCSHAIKTPNVFVVEDAAADPLFAENPLVTDGPKIRFYAGIPLRPHGGEPFGTLCVIDNKPRTMSDREREQLAILGRQVQTRLELRAKNRKLELANEVNARLSATLEESNQLFLTFMDHAPFASYIKDAAGRMVFYNRDLANRFNVNAEEWIGKLDDELWPEGEAEQFRANDQAVLEKGQMQEVLETMVDSEGTTIYWRSYKFPFQNRRGEMMLACMSLDATEDVRRERLLVESNRRLEVLAATDVLTGLANRRIFETRISELFAYATERRRALSLVVLDIDDFKKRNDQFGHAAGDHALTLVGGLLQRFEQRGFFASRIGGEEFAMLLPGLEAESAGAVAEEIRSELSRLEAGPLKLTVSLGVASLNGTTQNWGRLLARADDAMYEAKRRGKDRVMLHQHLVANLMDETESTVRSLRMREQAELPGQAA